MAKHPDFKPKIEQTIGHGLAILRQPAKIISGYKVSAEFAMS